MSQHDKADAHLDSVLRASGSALRHYSMKKSVDDMRMAMATAMNSETESLRAENERLCKGLAATVAALEFAMNTDCHSAFIRLWLHGQFDELRKEWPEAPEAIYDGQMKGGTT